MEADDSIIFCQKDLHSSSFAVFEDMRKKGELCDFKITMQNKEITAHRVVIASAIPYFRSAFGCNGDEVTVGDMDSKSLESLIDFAYSSRIKISCENVNHLLFASNFLRLEKVLEACVEFLSKRLDVSNIWHVRTLALNLDVTPLIEISNLYVLTNIEKLSRSVEFLNLPQSHLMEFLSKNDLHVSSEKVLFDAVIEWVKASSSERQPVLSELMDQIRLVYLPIEYLTEKAASEEVIRTSTISRDMIDEVKNYHLFPKKKSLFPSVKTNPRQFRGLYSICQDGSNVSVSYCDFVNHMWHSVSRSEQCGGDVLYTVAVSEKLYIFCETEINIFNTKTLQWQVIFQKWDERIKSTAIATAGNMIYCFGSSALGFNDRIWCFDTKNNTLLEKGRMTKGRYGAAAAALGRETECIYVTGGFDDSNTVEKYCPSTDQSSEVSSMLTGKVLHSAASMDGKLYVCGGMYSMNSLDMYDPVINQWTTLSVMNASRCVFSLVTHSSKLYALGGRNLSENSLRKSEIFCPQSNKWEFTFLIPEGFKNAVAID